MKTFILAFLLLSFLPAPPDKSKLAPPGTIFLKDNLYIDKQPVTNLAYVECLYAIEEFWSLSFSENIKTWPSFGIKPDRQDFMHEIDWLDRNRDFIEKMYVPKIKYPNVDTSVEIKKYLTDPAIRDFPVMGVTYEQAQLFCKWRSDMVMLLYAIRSANEKQRSKYYAALQYRLPTAEEWQQAFDKRGYMRPAFVNDAKPVNESKTKDKFMAYQDAVTELLAAAGTTMRVQQGDTLSFLVDTLKPDVAVPASTGFRCICEVQ